MKDDSYQPKVHRRQGGDELVVAADGAITVESSGQIDFEAGAELKLAGVALTPTAAELNLAGNAASVTVLSSGDEGVDIGNNGHTVIGSTTAGVLAYTILDPVAGALAEVFAHGSTGGLNVIPTNTGVTFNAAGHRKITFAAVDDYIVMRGRSATRWDIISSTGVTLGAT